MPSSLRACPTRKWFGTPDLQSIAVCGQKGEPARQLLRRHYRKVVRDSQTV